MGGWIRGLGRGGDDLGSSRGKLELGCCSVETKTDLDRGGYGGRGVRAIEGCIEARKYDTLWISLSRFSDFRLSIQNLSSQYNLVPSHQSKFLTFFVSLLSSPLFSSLLLPSSSRQVKWSSRQVVKSSSRQAVTSCETKIEMS